MPASVLVPACVPCFERWCGGYLGNKPMDGSCHLCGAPTTLAVFLAVDKATGHPMGATIGSAAAQ